MPIASPAPSEAPSSRQRANASSLIVFGASIAFGVCAWVQIINGSATAFSRQPVAMRSICRAAFWPSLPAQISVA